MTDAKAIRKAMMVAKLPPVGPAIQRLQELALAQPVQPLGIEQAMRLVRSAHAFGGRNFPFHFPIQYGCGIHHSIFFLIRERPGPWSKKCGPFFWYHLNHCKVG